jgi:predicted anti-sigma-YlaC factor YlaD
MGYRNAYPSLNSTPSILMFTSQTSARRSLRTVAICAVAAASLNACSVRQFALDQAANAIAGQGAGFSSDDDPELIRDAAPFSLKLIESFVAERPSHPGLLLAAAKGFTQYAYAFVQQDADEIEDQDVNAAFRLRERAAKLYRRARDYGLQGMGRNEAGFAAALRADPAKSLSRYGRDDVPLLYWTGAAWAGWIALSKDNADAVADLPVAMAVLDRALALDEAHGSGALHSLFVTLEMSRPGNADQAAIKAREHFQRAVQLSGGKLAGPYLALAEAVCIPRQDRKEFESLLKSALAIDPDAMPEARLENHIMQRRARWLLEHTDKFFME